MTNFEWFSNIFLLSIYIPSRTIFTSRKKSSHNITKKPCICCTVKIIPLYIIKKRQDFITSEKVLSLYNKKRLILASCETLNKLFALSLHMEKNVLFTTFEITLPYIFVFWAIFAHHKVTPNMSILTYIQFFRQFVTSSHTMTIFRRILCKLFSHYWADDRTNSPLILYGILGVF